jgi:hypothetical protein
MLLLVCCNQFLAAIHFKIVLSMEIVVCIIYQKMKSMKKIYWREYIDDLRNVNNVNGTYCVMRLLSAGFFSFIIFNRSLIIFLAN